MRFPPKVANVQPLDSSLRQSTFRMKVTLDTLEATLNYEGDRELAKVHPRLLDMTCCRSCRPWLGGCSYVS
jgi:hypothetical protein